MNGSYKFKSAIIVFEEINYSLLSIMNGLDEKTLLISSLKIGQQKYFKVVLLAVLFAFNFRLGLQLQASQTVLAPQPTLNKQSR